MLFRFAYSGPYYPRYYRLGRPIPLRKMRIVDSEEEKMRVPSRRHVRGMTLDKYRKTRAGPGPTCAQCFGEVDWRAVVSAANNGIEYIHRCGRKLA